MSFLAALPAIAEAAGGAAEAGAAAGATEAAAGATESGMSAGQMGRLANLNQGMADGKKENKKTKPYVPTMADVTSEVM
jgi:hypothetical protein